MKPIQDKAEVSIDFPEKFYVGSFARDSKFEARSEDDGLLIKLIRRSDEKRVVEIHLHHHLLADILSEWAESLADEPLQDEGQATPEVIQPLPEIQPELEELIVGLGGDYVRLTTAADLADALGWFLRNRMARRGAVQ